MFEQSIQNNAFGNWLSGFTDGEGTFLLYDYLDRRCGSLCHAGRFAITLRDDDKSILSHIKSYLNVGIVLQDKKRFKNRWGSRPQATFRVVAAADLNNVIVPHFERFPLRSKKSRDFAIWKIGVALLHKVATKPRRGRGGRNGSFPRWQPDEAMEFAELSRQLKAIREYTNLGSI